MTRGRAGGISKGIFFSGLLLVPALTADSQGNRIDNFQPKNPMTTKASVLCHVTATLSGDANYTLRFELRNPGTETVEIPTYEPFTAFSVIATAGTRQLTVHQPALDIPVKPQTIRVQPKATAVIETPIRLRISEGADPGTNGFVWTIPNERKTISLQVRLNLPGVSEILCPVMFH